MNGELRPLDKSEIARYLGCGPEGPDARTAALIRQCEEELLRAARPRYTYRVFDLRPQPEGIQVGESGFYLTGQAIRDHLAGCERGALLAATLSVETDRLIRTAGLLDPAAGLVMDCCATAAIEQLCDAVEAQIKAQFPGCRFPFRFSPGYGDLPLSLQRDFLAATDAQRAIGLTANDACMLIPVKSVTAVLGICRGTPAPPRHSCDICERREDCALRRKGEHCGF